MKIESTTYHCEVCQKKLKTYNNNLDIVTELNEENPWSRLHVKIIHRHGMYNDAEEEQADLCKPCAIKILTDALNRVKKGERATAGTESIEMGEW